jgi:hypothetical protein
VEDSCHLVWRLVFAAVLIATPVAVSASFQPRTEQPGNSPLHGWPVVAAQHELGSMEFRAWASPRNPGPTAPAAFAVPRAARR